MKINLNIKHSLSKDMSLQADLYKAYMKLSPTNILLSEISKDEYCTLRKYATEDLQLQLSNVDRESLRQYLKRGSRKLVLKVAADNTDTGKKLLRIFSIFAFMHQLDISLSSDIQYDKIEFVN